MWTPTAACAAQSFRTWTAHAPNYRLTSGNPAHALNAAARCITRQTSPAFGAALIVKPSTLHPRRGVAKQTNYDKWQFFVNGTHPVEAHYMGAEAGWASNGVAFEDYNRMNIRVRRSSNERRFPTPAWGVNDKLLRELLVVFMEEHAGVKVKWPACKTKKKLKERLLFAQSVITQKQWPEKSRVLTNLCKRYVNLKNHSDYATIPDAEIGAKYCEVFEVTTPGLFGNRMREELDYFSLRNVEMQIENLDTFLRVHRGGGADIVAAMAYLYYRAGMDSVGVGAELGLKPPHVRTTLFRLNETWAAWHPLQAGGTMGVANKVARANPQTDGASKGIGFITHNMFEGL